MRTRTTPTPNDAPTDNAHLEALAKAMAAHPAVKVELDAARKQVRAAENKASALQSVLDDYADKIGKTAGSSTAAPALSDADIAAVVEKMTPMEKAATLLKATRPTRFDFRTSAPAVEGMFGH